MNTIEQLLNQGIEFLSQGAMEQAEQSFQSVLNQDSQNSHALHFVGIILAQKGQIPAAIEKLNLAIELNPQSQFVGNLANAHYMAGNLPQAIANYERAIQLDYGNLEAYLPLAQILHSQGRLDEAIGYLRLVLKLNPQENRAKDLLTSFSQ